jgi:cytochrome c-type biogenesis protein CcmH
MMQFWAMAAAMVALALVFVLPPLLRGKPAAGDQNAANVAIFKQRLAELEREAAGGGLTEQGLAEARAELERQLLGDLRPQSATAKTKPARGVAAAVALLVPALAAGLYFQLGGLPLDEQPTAQIPADREGQIAFIRDNLEELQAKVAAEPENLEGWLMLARSHMVLEQYQVAADALARAERHLGEQPDLLASRAEAAGYAAQGDLTGLPSQLLQRALAIEPAHPKALWLAGLAALQGEDNRQAELYWRRLLAVLPPESGTAAQVEQMLTRLEPAPASAAKLAVTVRLDPALAQGLPPEATVFVLARAAEGPRAPLAVVRRQVRDLPLTLTLDDSMAMVPEMNLSRFPQVVVEARVSRSGAAAAASGDLIGRSEPVRPGGEPLEILIGQTVP